MELKKLKKLKNMKKLKRLKSSEKWKSSIITFTHCSIALKKIGMCKTES